MNLIKKVYKFLKKTVKPKVSGKNKYTVICTVYNVEKYLNDFFTSMTEQTLKFEDHIYLLMIDDGSPDGSAEIIKSWQKKYPKNIKYIKKENGGQASAFNFGLQYIETPWVTFIDPDDTVNKVYFETVDKYSDNDIGMISCNLIFHIEETGEYKKHYINYRFKKKVTIVNPKNMQKMIQQNISSVFVQTKLIRDKQINFDPKIIPVFYDGCFVNQMLLQYPEINIAFLRDAKYYYRKREDNSSIVNTAWQNHSRYLNALEYGLLKLLQDAKKTHGKPPVYLQRFILYQIHYYYKRIVNDKDKLDFLAKEEIQKFKNLLIELFSYIDAEVIEVCALGGLWHKYRMGFYNLYKNKVMFKQVCYIDGYDKSKKELKVHYYYHSDIQEIFLLNGNMIQPRTEEIIKHNFLGEVFVYEKIIYLPLVGLWEYLDIKLDNVETQISLNKKRYKTGIQINDLIKVSI